MKYVLVSVVVVAVVLAPDGVTRAETKSPWIDLPRAFDLRESGTGSWLSVECALSGKRRASCSFSQATFTQPEPGLIAEQIKRLRAAPKAEKERDFKKACKSGELPSSELLVRFRAACDSKSLAAFEDALEWFMLNMEAKTCTLHVATPFTLEFKQLSANVWQSVGDAACNTTVMTLFRASPDTLWEYKQVRSSTSSEAFCAGLKDSITLWTWRRNGTGMPMPLTCSYLSGRF